MQDKLEMSTEQRLNFVAVNKTFQGRRKVLLDQRQSIYGLLQRPSTRYNNAEDIIIEFLKVPVALSCGLGVTMGRTATPALHALLTRSSRCCHDTWRCTGCWALCAEGCMWSHCVI